jgi:hypothetical protein
MGGQEVTPMGSGSSFRGTVIKNGSPSESIDIELAWYEVLTAFKL